MLGNAARHLHAAGARYGICELSGFRLPKEAFLLPPQTIPSRMRLPKRHPVVYEQLMDESSICPLCWCYRQVQY